MSNARSSMGDMYSGLQEQKQHKMIKMIKGAGLNPLDLVRFIGFN